MCTVHPVPTRWLPHGMGQVDTPSPLVLIIDMLVTSIGSLPFTDVGQAVDAVLEFCPAIPFWPQLPNRSFHERMYVQCLENVPAVVVDEVAETMYVDTGSTKGIEHFYENVSARNLEAFSISDRAAPGLYALLDRLSDVREAVTLVKVQLVGPFTLGMGLKDEKGKANHLRRRLFRYYQEGAPHEGRVAGRGPSRTAIRT